MSKDMIDEMQVIIASLTSRVEELEDELLKCKSQDSSTNSQKDLDSPHSDAPDTDHTSNNTRSECADYRPVEIQKSLDTRKDNIITVSKVLDSDEEMYHSIIATLQDEVKSGKERILELEKMLLVARECEKNAVERYEMLKFADVSVSAVNTQVGEIAALNSKIDSLNAELTIATTYSYCADCGENTQHERDMCVQCAIIQYQEKHGRTAADIASAESENKSYVAEITCYQQIIADLTKRLAAAYGISE